MIKITKTNKGVKTTVTFYKYPDGHGNIAQGGVNIPVADEHEMMAELSMHVLRPLDRAAKKRT